MRARRTVEVRIKHLGDVEGEIQADQVALLQRPEHGQARAETFLDHGIDRFGVAHPGGDQRDRLALHRVLQPVADEAGNIAADMDRDFSGLAEKLHGLAARPRCWSFHSR